MVGKKAFLGACVALGLMTTGAQAASYVGYRLQNLGIDSLRGSALSLRPGPQAEESSGGQSMTEELVDVTMTSSEGSSRVSNVSSRGSTSVTPSPVDYRSILFGRNGSNVGGREAIITGSLTGRSPRNFRVVRTGAGDVRTPQTVPDNVMKTPLPGGLPLILSALAGLGYLSYRRRA